MDWEKTLVILKPDAVARGLIGAIVSRFEKKGLTISAMRLATIAHNTAEKHYDEHKNKPFFSQLTSFITSGPVVLMAIEGRGAIAVVRKMVGATLGRAAEPGSIRGDYGMSVSYNLVHASDSATSAARELALFFRPEDYMPSPDQNTLRWNYEFSEGGPN